VSIPQKYMEVSASDKGSKEEPSSLKDSDDTKMWRTKFEPEKSFIKFTFTKSV
jgi:hypothetical protein